MMASPSGQTPGLGLEPLTALSLKEQVIRQLTGLIEDGSLPRGQCLPSERDLSERLKVSRGTVREAVQFLHALGVVEIRHGRGTFVRAAPGGPDGSLRDEWRRWTERHAAEIRPLLEVRRGLECFAAELAARRVDAAGLAELDEALALMHKAHDREDVTALVDADISFHRALCAAAGNAALVDLAASLGDQLTQERGAVWGVSDRPNLSLAEHRAIFEAVRDGDADGAREAVAAHLLSVERTLDTLLSDLNEGRRPVASDLKQEV